MPAGNKFHHQPYAPGPPTAPYAALSAEPPPAEDSAEYRQTMQGVGEVFRRCDVRAIYLIHGTFIGTDALGLVGEIGQFLPKAQEPLQRLHKQALDALMHDVANFTPEYARRFEQAMQTEGRRTVPVRLFNWSSENHHIGRAHGAVRLLDHLAATLGDSPPGRILLWGHSHGGNVLALLTNLLASDRPTRDRFFRAARTYYRWPWLGAIDEPVWPRVQQLLNRKPHPLAGMAIDLVTLGTPIRYGWDSNGYSRLLHFVYHRPQPGLPPYQAPFPPTADDLLAAAHGDAIQQLGVAGTNFPPTPLAWRSWLAERRLCRLVQAGLRQRDLLARLQLGLRVHEEGQNLLVDYGPTSEPFREHLAGHAVYTRSHWLPFHAQQVARWLYDKG